MKEITLNLSPVSCHTVAAFLMGGFFNPDSTADECLNALKNVEALRKNMTPELCEDFDRTIKTFIENKEVLREKSKQMLDEFNNLFENL